MRSKSESKLHALQASRAMGIWIDLHTTIPIHDDKNEYADDFSLGSRKVCLGVDDHSINMTAT